MDNNSRNIKTGIRLNPNRTKQLLLDPNFGNENVPIENLSIECDLSVYERSRSFIGVVRDEEGNEKKKIAELKEAAVPFNQGTKFGENFSLSTNYTEVSDAEYDGTETLGITNVKIEYNSSYMPLITIDLVDIKGKMFQMGKKGPYSPFFNFPYPLFELKIKGYFGKPVVYLLHMTKFTSRLDSENGNFEITCDFTGYTYAYLSDMLLGYLKAVPYTTVGREVMNEKKINDSNFVTFNNLYEYASKLNEKITSLKLNDKGLQALALAQQISDSLSEIKSLMVSKLRSYDNNSQNFQLNTDNGVLIMHDESLETVDADKPKQIDLIIEYLTENLSEKVSEHNILAKNSPYTLSKDLYSEIKSGVNQNIFKYVDTKRFLDDEGKSQESYSGDVERFKDIPYLTKISNLLKRITNKLGDNKFALIDLTKNITEIDSKLEILTETIKGGQTNKQETVFDEISNLEVEDDYGNPRTFDFNIHNYTKVLADHVDILMETIRRVDKYAENNPTRNSDLRDNTELYDINGDDKADKVYAFPDYRVKDASANNSALTDTWIGTDYPNIDEVLFIKELHQGLLRAKKDEEIFTTRLEETNSQWYGVNPFDSMVFTQSNNPWESVNNTTGSDGDILRLMLMRAITFLGVTVRAPQPNEINAMAKLEANNLFRTILNAEVKDFMSDIGNNPKDISNRIRNLSNSVNLTNKNNFSDVNFSKIMSSEVRNSEGHYSSGIEKQTQYENYVYIGGHVSSTNITDVIKDGKISNDVRYFLPLYFSGNKNKYKGDEINMVSNEDRIKLREEGSIFFGDYMGNHLIGNDKPDVGATYIQIRDPKEFELKYNDSSYGQKIIEKEGVISDKVWEYEYLNTGNFKNVLFNGKTNSNEFYNYNKDGKTYPFYNYFYTDETISSKPPELTFKKALSMTSKGTQNGSFSYLTYNLFGSQHYNAQNSAGRAFLFLNSLPFKVSDGKIFASKILNIFDKKAGIIEVPYSWVLYIGAILYRKHRSEMVEFTKDGVSTLPLPLQIPERHEPLVVNGVGNIYGKNQVGAKYDELDIVIDKLPMSVKNILMDELFDWVHSGKFRVLQDELEMFDQHDLPSREERKALWLSSDDKEYKKTDSTILTDRFKANYEGYKRMKYDAEGMPIGDITSEEFDEKVKEEGDLLNFDLKLKESENGYSVLTKFLQERKVLVNATWRIWANDLEGDLGKDFIGFFTKEQLVGDTYPITFRTENLNTYLTVLVTEFQKLVKEFNNDERRTTGIFGGNNMNEIYLTMYKNIKSINDKWISGENSIVRSSFTNLIDTFNFIDRGYNDIGTAFKLNPMSVTALLTSNYNNSFYSHISKILSNNNFDFIPMPNYIDMGSEKTMEGLFETNSYSSDVTPATSSFVCMYVGEKSGRLDVGDNFNDDGLNFGDETGLPDDFNQVPAILIRYGDQNQSIFKSLSLDQSEFSETNESLMTTDQIASSYNNINSIGQNIFDVYNNRSYNAEVDMLGNAMMQPFLYFQLDNVPMFRGGYVITKVSHNIIPNHMTTKIKGNRVKYVKTKLLDKDTVFYNMIGNLSDIIIGDVTLDDLPKEKIGGSDNSNDEVAKRKPSPIITADMTDKEVYLKSFIPKGGTTQKDYLRESNTKKDGKFMTYQAIFEEVAALTGVPILTLQVMSVMESAIGKIKGTNDMNGSGYIGLMQFGSTATTDIIGRLNGNKTFFSIPNLDKYEFHAVIDYNNKTLVRPNTWTKDTSVNNKTTNSFYDDYVSTLSSAILAKANIKHLGSTLNNVADVYLSHQQGAGGLRTIKNNLTSTISSNAQNNPPPYFKYPKYNQDWYLSWAAHVEATSKNIFPDYEVIVGKGVV